MRALIGLLICLVVAGGFYEYHKVHSVAKGVFGAGDGKISKKLQKGEPVSVLAMGTDVGALDRGNKGGNTDSLELFTINPKKSKLSDKISKDMTTSLPSLTNNCHRLCKI